MSGCLDIARVVSGDNGIQGVQGVAKGHQSYAEDERLCLGLGQQI
jgi:hypothetical protein